MSKVYHVLPQTSSLLEETKNGMFKKKNNLSERLALLP